MRPAGATFWSLGGLNGWQRRTASSDLAVSDSDGLRLTAAAGGLLSLQSSNGSFGGLTLPRGFAFDSGLTLYLLADDGRIRRYDGESHAFVPFLQFDGASSMAIIGDWLYVAIPKPGRVQIFDLKRFVLADTLEHPGWHPIDLAANQSAVYILDARHGRVFRHAPYELLTRVLKRPDRAGKWSRIAVDRDGRFYLLNQTFFETDDRKAPPITDASTIRDRFDAPPIVMDEQGRFTLPASLAGVCGRRMPAPSQPAKTASDITLAARGDFLLYVVRRRKRRVDAYTDDGRRLRHSWGADLDWQPCDVAACGDTAFILDERGQAVHRHNAGREELKLLFRDDGNRHWTRIACDGGRLFLYSAGAAKVQQFDCNGTPRGECRYADVRTMFEATRPEAPQSIGTGLTYDRQGSPATIDPSEPSEKPLYTRSGQWQSKPLDSLKYHCQWHRLELQLAEFPPGSRITVSTCAHEAEEDVFDAIRSQWVDGQTIVAPIGGAPKSSDFLVQSGQGRYLSLRLKLDGDGFSTPAIAAMKVHYPRESYLEYLPATYSTDDESRVFLERFLAIFQTDWDERDRTIDELERLFDPDAVPEGPFLDYLASQWLGLPLEGTWNGEQKRRLLSAAPKIYPHRGQVRGLRDFIAVYLANLSGLETKDVQQLEFPVIVEGFRERELLITGSGDNARLGSGAPLWSASVNRRLQLGVYATEGEARLVSVGDPEHDVFAKYAHRFRVCVPAAWVRTADDERMLRRAIDAEKPAHTQYELCLIEPRFRIGTQSTIGVDSVIGEAPAVHLGCACNTDPAPSLPPNGRLGFDTVLSGDERGGAELVLG